MSSPITPRELLTAFKKWDVRYREIDGWRTYGRDDETGKPFGPVFGCMTHHTGSDAPDINNRQLIRNGRSDLPGPLAHFGMNDNGVVDIISIGRANHAGGGDPQVLTAVKLENYDLKPPPSDKHEGEAGAADGNDCFYGVECYYSGGHPMTNDAYTSLVKLWAAICDHHGWSAKSVIGHGEWSDWKWDPGNVSMIGLRRDIQQALNAKKVATLMPKSKTPNITEAIKKNIAYARSLDEIGKTGGGFQVELDKYSGELKKQRFRLREEEEIAK